MRILEDRWVSGYASLAKCGLEGVAPPAEALKQEVVLPGSAERRKARTTAWGTYPY